jgi:hypothetical protein
LDAGLAATVGSGALLTLCEGFTDYEEDAALWRAANLDANGNPRTYSQTGYEYPNQRLNILRKYSRNPFPAVLKLEAEGCDSYGGAAGGNGRVNYYRNGNIAIQTTTDTMGGYNIGWMQSGEWFQWEEVPFSGTPSLAIRVATPISNMRAHVEIDGVAQPSRTLPNTGSWQTWTTFDFGPIGTYPNSYHRVRIVFETGGMNFNWWQLSTSGSGGIVANGTYKVIARHSGKALEVEGGGTANGSNVQQWSYFAGDHQRWKLTHLGSNQYSIMTSTSGKALDVEGASTADGANVLIWSYLGGANQKWTIAPTSGGYYSVRAVHSSKALDVSGISMADGAKVHQWGYWAGDNQQWSFQAP